MRASLTAVVLLRPSALAVGGGVETCFGSAG
jgi:hypothetical protein